MFTPGEIRHALKPAENDLKKAAALLWSVKEAAANALGCGFHLVDPLQVIVYPSTGPGTGGTMGDVAEEVILSLPFSKVCRMRRNTLNTMPPVVAVCNSAYRSNLALGILERNGFEKATSLKGGSQAWIDAGYQVFGADTQKSDAAPVVAAKREIKMPSRMSPAQLKGLILDLPGSFELVDIRPSMMYRFVRMALERHMNKSFRQNKAV